MFFELRQYKTQPGQRDNWVRYMEEVIIPHEVSNGMVVAGSFIDQEDDNHYIWMRRFESEEERVRLYEAAYENDTWKNEIQPRVPEMLELGKAVITRIEPTPKSVVRKVRLDKRSPRLTMHPDLVLHNANAATLDRISAGGACEFNSRGGR